MKTLPEEIALASGAAVVLCGSIVPYNAEEQARGKGPPVWGLSLGKTCL